MTSACLSGFGHRNNVSYIYLLGFPDLYNFNIYIFLLLVVIYCVTMCGNVLIITLVAMDRHLHSPMYFFISVISFLDIVITTDILPVFLHIVIYGGGSMSLGACILQFYVFANAEASECVTLAVMSYDRYVAICNPLRYNAIINKMLCLELLIGSWLFSISMMLVHEIATSQLVFCGPNVINHFFCDLPPVVELSCSDISTFLLQINIISIIVILCPFILVIVSYVLIITTILNIRSTSGRQKAFSTCSSHLTAVSLFYGSLFSAYMIPNKGQFLAVNKVLSLLYTVVIPLLNPFIYTLRNKDFIEALKKVKQK